VLGWIGKESTEANLELDEPPPVGAPVVKKRSVIAGEKGTSRSTSPAAASLCHGREHVLGRDEMVAHALATPIPARRSTAMNRDQAYPPPFVCFTKFLPKSELKSNFYQKETCAKFCELQNIFMCPKLILSGN